MKITILSRNVRGLGRGDQRWCLRDICAKWGVDIIVLQETKFQSFGLAEAIDLWEQCNWDFLHWDAISRAGGIPVAWNTDVIEIRNSRVDSHSILNQRKCVSESFEWALSKVYDPNKASSIPSFLKNWQRLEDGGMTCSNCPLPVGKRRVAITDQEEEIFQWFQRIKQLDRLSPVRGNLHLV